MAVKGNNKQNSFFARIEKEVILLFDTSTGPSPPQMKGFSAF